MNLGFQGGGPGGRRFRGPALRLRLPRRLSGVPFPGAPLDFRHQLRDQPLDLRLVFLDPGFLSCDLLGLLDLQVVAGGVPLQGGSGGLLGAQGVGLGQDRLAFLLAFERLRAFGEVRLELLGCPGFGQLGGFLFLRPADLVLDGPVVEDVGGELCYLGASGQRRSEQAAAHRLLCGLSEIHVLDPAQISLGHQIL